MICDECTLAEPVLSPRPGVYPWMQPVNWTRRCLLCHYPVKLSTKCHILWCAGRGGGEWRNTDRLWINVNYQTQGHTCVLRLNINAFNQHSCKFKNLKLGEHCIKYKTALKLNYVSEQFHFLFENQVKKLQTSPETTIHSHCAQMKRPEWAITIDGNPSEFLLAAWGQF